MVPGATLVKLQARLLAPAATLLQPPPAEPAVTDEVTVMAGVMYAGAGAPGDATFRMPGSGSARFSVGMACWPPPAGVVRVMRQNCVVAAPASVGALATASTQVVPSIDDSLRSDTAACPLTTSVATRLPPAVAQSLPVCPLPGGCGPAEAGRPSSDSMVSPVQARLASVTWPTTAATVVRKLTASEAPGARLPAALRTHSTRRLRAALVGSALTVTLQVQPEVTLLTTSPAISSGRR